MTKKLLNMSFLRNDEFNKIMEENSNLKTSNTNLKLKNNDLNYKLKSLRNQSNNLYKNNNDLSNKVLSLINDNEKYVGEIATLKEENINFANEINDLKQKINALSEKKKYEMDFVNFQEFHSKSYISPIVEAPFDNEDKRVFAFMDHLGKHLRKNVSEGDFNPLISIIMPTYNRKNIIQNSINSVLNQSYPYFELIIIDDGSTDGTDNLLNSVEDDRVKIFRNDINKGCSYSRNVGLKHANGDIIMYLDSDNEWDSEYIKTMVGAFIELPDADALYSGQFLYRTFDSKPYAIRFGSYNKPLLHNHNYIDLNCFCHKKHVLNEIGGFDESISVLIDWDLILKISNIFKIYSVPVILSKYFNHDSENRISNSSFDYVKVCKNVLDKNKILIKPYLPLNKKISIIIPNYESLDQIKICIDSVLSNESQELLDIIVVDNNSGDEVKEYLINLESEGKIRLILNKVNYGFSYAVNQGINISEKDSDILLLNNDAILTQGSLEHMQHCAYSIPKCGLIVPHEMLFEGNNTIPLHVPYADISFECDATPSKAHQNIINIPLFHDGGLLELNFAPFFCTYIKRDVYNKTLGLDAELGRHYRSDRIFSDFVRHYLQLKIYQAPEAYVYHRHKVATNKLRETNKEEYKYIYSNNQWESNLANELGFKKPIWDD